MAAKALNNVSVQMSLLLRYKARRRIGLKYRRIDQIEAKDYFTEVPTIYTKCSINPKSLYILKPCMKQ